MSVFTFTNQITTNNTEPRTITHCDICNVDVRYYNEHTKSKKHMQNTAGESTEIGRYYRQQYNKQYYQKNKQKLREAQKTRYDKLQSSPEYCPDCDVWTKNWKAHSVRKTHIQNNKVANATRITRDVEAMQRNWAKRFKSILT